MIHIPKIIIRAIQPENQRYSTVGDWYFDAEENTLTISVSKMGDWRSELAVAIHEAIEACACLHEDIDQTQVDQFDFMFEEYREDGNDVEPGDSLNAPYHEQHVAATLVENEVCARLKLSWPEHERNVSEA